MTECLGGRAKIPRRLGGFAGSYEIAMGGQQGLAALRRILARQRGFRLCQVNARRRVLGRCSLRLGE